MKDLFNKLKSKLLSILLKLRKNYMSFGLLIIIFVFLAIFMILPIIYITIAAGHFRETENAEHNWEAQYTLEEAALFIKGEREPAELNIVSEMNPDSILVIINGNGEIIYKTRSLPPDFELSIKSINDDTGFIYTNDTAIYYKKLSSDYFAYYYTPKINSSIIEFTIVLTIGFAAIAIITLIFFIKSVYNPIVLMEKVLNGIVDGKTDFNLNQTRKPGPLNSIFSDLDKLLLNMKQLMLRESNAQLLKKQAELDALQSQISPHFLYNTLDCIRGQALRYGLNDIEIMTRSLSKLFRYSISNNSTLVSLEEELNNIKNYLAIQQMRFNNKFIEEFEIDNDTLQCKIPKLIIQPIIENAIHHGLETKIGRGTLTIRSYITEQRLIINIQDDGCGIPQNRLEEINSCLTQNKPIENLKAHKVSVGLVNVNSRIKLCFGDLYGLNIYSTQDIGTDIQFNLPLLNDKITSAL